MAVMTDKTERFQQDSRLIRQKYELPETTIGCTCTVQHPGIKITRKRFVKQSQLHEELVYAVDCLTVEMARRL